MMMHGSWGTISDQIIHLTEYKEAVMTIKIGI